jgi:hypothetical protein
LLSHVETLTQKAVETAGQVDSPAAPLVLNGIPQVGEPLPAKSVACIGASMFFGDD